MTKLKLPFELEKPSTNEYVTQADKIGYGGIPTACGLIYDISIAHAVSNVPTQYASLSAALGTNGANIPQDVRRGGMSVKFINSTTNKYEQWNLKASSWSTDISDWTQDDLMALFEKSQQYEDIEKVELCDNSGNKIHEISKKKADFHNLHSDGHKVLTDKDSVVSEEDLEEALGGMTHESIISDKEKIDLTTNNGVKLLSFDKNGLACRAFKNVKGSFSLHVPLEKMPYSAMTHVSVKSVGGDYTDIMSAVNAITNASEINQYMIDLYEDIEITDISKLYKAQYPDQHSDAVPTTACAVYVGKNYVHLRGVGARKKIYVHPADLNITGTAFGFIQCAFLRGNIIIDNIDFTIKGGRYALHQESGGNPLHLDVNATTIIRNCVATHLGNDDYTNGSSWTAVHAQANGTSSGATYIYENVKWYAYSVPFYFHGNNNSVTKDGADLPPHIIFRDCSAETWGSVSNDVIGLGVLGSSGNGERGVIEMEGCSINRFEIKNEARGDEPNLNTKSNLYMAGGFDLVGSGNAPSLVQENKPSTLSFKVIENGYEISLSGNAVAVIYGDELYRYAAASDANCIIWGSLRIQESSVYALGKRLGDCSSASKTLTITVTDIANNTSVNGNVVFDSNYTNTSMADILTSINSQIAILNLGVTITASVGENLYELITFKDNIEYFSNAGEDSLEIGTVVTKDVIGYTMGFRKWQSGDTAYGIIGRRVNKPLSNTQKFSSFVIRLNNIFFARSLNINSLPSSSGKYYYVDTGGVLKISNTLHADTLYRSVGGNQNAFLIKI